MSIANQLENKLLDLVLTNTSFAPITAVYGELHTADPGETCTNAPLASTPRMAIVFNAAASATSVNATAVNWVTSASGTISHMSLWDGSATATALALWSGALATTKNVNVGDTISLASGALTVTLD